MNGRKLGLKEQYWREFQIQEEDLEFVYNHLLETEIPLTTEELVRLILAERIRREKENLKRKQADAGQFTIPEGFILLDRLFSFLP